MSPNGPALVPPPVAAAQSEYGHYFGDAFAKLPQERRVNHVIDYLRHQPEQTFAPGFLLYQAVLQLGRLEQVGGAIVAELQATRAAIQHATQDQARTATAATRMVDLVGQFGRMVDDHLDALGAAWEVDDPATDAQDAGAAHGDEASHDDAEGDDDGEYSFIDEDGQAVDLSPTDS